MMIETYWHQRKGSYERPEIHVAKTSVKSQVKQISCINKNETWQEVREKPKGLIFEITCYYDLISINSVRHGVGN